MNCPLLSDDTLDLLLDFSAGRLDPLRAAELSRHMDVCPACAVYRDEQAVLWTAMDEWRPEPVDVGFNRAVWRKIDEAERTPWYRSLGVLKQALALAAAVLVVSVGFLFDHNPVPTPAVTIGEVEQVEEALDDVQLLRQFENAPADSQPL